MHLSLYMSENAESGDGSDIFGYYGDSDWVDDEYYDSDSDDCWLEVDESVIGTFEDVDDLEYVDVYEDVVLDDYDYIRKYKHRLVDQLMTGAEKQFYGIASL